MAPPEAPGKHVDLPLTADPVLGIARAAIALRPALCAACLGRGFAKVATGLTNAARGEAIRGALPATVADAPSCTLCRGMTGNADRYAGFVVRALDGWEFASFRIGSHIDPTVEAIEENLWKAAGSTWHEPLRREIDREVGKRVEALTGTRGDATTPDIVALVDTRFDRVTLDVRSLYLYGRYRKHLRGIPQTRWPCRICRGRGCRRCNGTGKMYATSVEEIIAAPALALFGGAGSAFHGMGREDIDARMLGTGRPFVLEIVQPHRRAGDVPVLEGAINLAAAGDVEVQDLRWSSRNEVVAVKDARHAKTYIVDLVTDGVLPSEKLAEVAAFLSAKRIKQRTPVRVSHRRSDLVRERELHSVRVLDVRPDGARLEITGEAGVYVKELVSGDEGRTEPSVAGLLGMPAHVTSLDVIAVHDIPGPGGGSSTPDGGE